jgi:hypothetical protein
MSTWAAIAAREAATAASAGTTALHAIAPSALDGFAVGALLTGVCFLIIIAPRAFRRDRLSARQGMWSGSRWHSRVRPDYYATPAETGYYATSAESEFYAAPAEPEFHAAPAGADFYATTAAADSLATPAAPGNDAVPAGADPYAAPAEAYFYAAPAEAHSPAEAYPHGAGVSQLAVATTAGLAAEDVLLAQADRGREAFRPSSSPPSQGFAGHAGADPYADPFGAAADDDIVLPGDDTARDEGGGRGYRSKHRMTGQESPDRRQEPRRSPPRHAAPSSRSRFGTRMSSRIAMFPLAPARG